MPVVVLLKLHYNKHGWQEVEKGSIKKIFALPLRKNVWTGWNRKWGLWNIKSAWYKWLPDQVRKLAYLLTLVICLLKIRLFNRKFNSLQIVCVSFFSILHSLRRILIEKSKDYNSYYLFYFLLNHMMSIICKVWLSMLGTVNLLTYEKFVTTAAPLNPMKFSFV